MMSKKLRTAPLRAFVEALKEMAGLQQDPDQEQEFLDRANKALEAFRCVATAQGEETKAAASLRAAQRDPRLKGTAVKQLGTAAGFRKRARKILEDLGEDPDQFS